MPLNGFPLGSWVHLSLRTAEMLSASAQVIGMRLTRMAVAGHSPSAGDRREMRRMVAEKTDAGLDAFSAAGSQMFAEGFRMSQQMLTAQWRAVMSFWLSPGSMRAGSLNRLASAMIRHASRRALEKLAAPAARMTHRMLTPYRSRARANAKRLRGKR
jgi:hypothetical protein